MDATLRNTDLVELVDVTGVDLSDLVDLEESAMVHSLRRILAELDSSDGAVAGWNSAI